MLSMTRRSDIAKHARGRLIPVCCALLLVYFGYHAIQGDRGLLSWVKLSDQIGEARIALDVTADERATLERKVALLRPEGLDPDMLDERARYMLSLARPDEVVIYIDASTAD
jgi:cell division protein FtsB